MEIWGYNKGWDATGEGEFSPLVSLAKRLNDPATYPYAFNTFQSLDLLQQQEVLNMCDNKVQQQISIDTYKQGF